MPLPGDTEMGKHNRWKLVWS